MARANSTPMEVAAETNEVKKELQGDTITEKIADVNIKDDWLINIMTPRGEKTENRSHLKPLIQKVTWRLRKVQTYKECFDPAFASIGPYHHGKPELQTAEELKIPCAQRFVEACKQNVEVIYNKVVEVVRQARECYADDSTTEFNDEKFTRIMFLDGCFVLHFIYCTIQENTSDSMMCSSYFTALLMRDLFLLENQLPYVILQTLLSLRFEGENVKDPINEFIIQVISPPDCSPKKDPPSENDRKPLHLLDLLRIKLLGVPPISSPQSSISISQFRDWHSFRSVNELQAIGIIFKKGHSICLKGITFKQGKVFGEVSLPPIVIDDLSKSRFLNLIAYELCPDSSHDYGIVSYICFMDALIDHADDVKELRSKGILLNMLGSDQEVAHLFNQLGNDMVPDHLAYYEVKGGIETHYRNKTKVSLVEFFTTHFRSPWTAVAFFAAGLVIILTYIQTYFAIFCANGYLSCYQKQ